MLKICRIYLDLKRCKCLALDCIRAYKIISKCIKSLNEIAFNRTVFSGAALKPKPSSLKNTG